MIVITGASKGIGRYLFEEFKRRGECVVGTYHSTPVVAVELFNVDITDNGQIQSFVSSLPLSGNSKITLINCAGISYNSFAHKAEYSEWHKVIHVNLNGTFNVIRAFLPIMRANGYGRIINFSSVVTQYPTLGVSAYACSKSALNALTKCLAYENSSKGITVNSINLSYTNTGMGIYDVPMKYKNEIMQKIPLQRFCDPHEILQLVDCIISTEYLSGSIIDLNGALI